MNAMNGTARSRFRAAVVVVVAVVAVLAGCGGQPAQDGHVHHSGYVGEGDQAAAAVRAVEARDLHGRWFPAGSVAAGRAFVEFTPDGRWSGSDGCNAERGSWKLESGGKLVATAEPSTYMQCENVPVEWWVSHASRAELAGQVLILLGITARPAWSAPKTEQSVGDQPA